MNLLLNIKFKNAVQQYGEMKGREGNMRVIKEYKKCEYCKGTGLEWEGEYSADCRVCQGYGEVLVNVRKGCSDEQLSSGNHEVT